MFWAAGFLPAAAADVDVSKLPPLSAKKIDFDADVRPLFENHCYRCHGLERPKSGFQLTNRAAALKGGKNGVDIMPGKSAESPLIHYVAGLVEDMQMPPEGKGEPLTAEEIGMLRAWIDQGAIWGKTPVLAGPPIEFRISPELRWTTVTGNEQKFREQFRMREGWSGGAERFSLEQNIDDRTRVTVDGRALGGQEDYRVAMTIERRDLGFIRTGAEQYRLWSDDLGGHNPALTPQVFSLDRDLHMDVGRAWFDAGLTLPNWPRIVAGYEYQNKDGEKSLLEWGSVSSASGAARKIYPSWKEIDEQVHIMKLNVSQEINGFRWEDDFRAELYDLETRRHDVLEFSLDKDALEKGVVVKEAQDHFQAANSVRLERQALDWLYVSGGYLFTILDGEAAFRQSTFLTPTATIPIFPDDKFWFSQRLLLDQTVHMFNLNALAGPWDGLNFYGGVQNEWMRQHGLGNVRLDEGVGLPGFEPEPVLVDSDLDKAAVEERVGMRYTGIPLTVLFAEARWDQQSIGQFEEQVGGDHAFLRDTDASSQLQEYKTGFAISPWVPVSWETQVKFKENDSGYNHRRDEAFGGPNVGYSAFIRSRRVESEEVETKLVLRPARWLKTTLSYRLVASDYHTATDPVIVPEVIIPGLPPFPASITTPGGEVFAGNYDAHVFSLNNTLNPWTRWRFSGTFSYQKARTSTARASFPGVVDYQGDVYSALTEAAFHLNAATDLDAGYNFSWANFSQGQYAAGQPLGIEYRRHEAHAGITRRFQKSITARLQYAFYRYDEPTLSGAADFTAHGVMGLLSFVFP